MRHASAKLRALRWFVPAAALLLPLAPVACSHSADKDVDPAAPTAAPTTTASAAPTTTATALATAAPVVVTPPHPTTAVKPPPDAGTGTADAAPPTPDAGKLTTGPADLGKCCT